MRLRIAKRGFRIAAVLTIATPLAVHTQQTMQDEHAVYELLAPETASFRTVYEVSATKPGAKAFFDRIGSGLAPTNADGDGAYDMMTGAALKHERVTGPQAKAHGLADADPSATYFEIQ